ncbi:uncharacterized protein LOC113286215 [Papaver somniferum]|uniref:uncharacterized protein LOC113286215 n=1 Tax=Papaver somniferum TaxID=3469 RepID=UPI000E6FD409|nr:uncharacterized protein LOC113286215 [Papaver somniferum]
MYSSEAYDLCLTEVMTIITLLLLKLVILVTYHHCENTMSRVGNYHFPLGNMTLSGVEAVEASNNYCVDQGFVTIRTGDFLKEYFPIFFAFFEFSSSILVGATTILLFFVTKIWYTFLELLCTYQTWKTSYTNLRVETNNGRGNLVDMHSVIYSTLWTGYSKNIYRVFLAWIEGFDEIRKLETRDIYEVAFKGSTSTRQTILGLPANINVTHVTWEPGGNFLFIVLDSGFDDSANLTTGGERLRNNGYFIKSTFFPHTTDVHEWSFRDNYAEQTVDGREFARHSSCVYHNFRQFRKTDQLHLVHYSLMPGLLSFYTICLHFSHTGINAPPSIQDDDKQHELLSSLHLDVIPEDRKFVKSLDEKDSKLTLVSVMETDAILKYDAHNLKDFSSTSAVHKALMELNERRTFITPSTSSVSELYAIHGTGDNTDYGQRLTLKTTTREENCCLI